MAVDRDLLKHLVDLVDGDGWQLADLLAGAFPADEYGEAGDHAGHGLYAALEEYETAAAADYGVELKASTMRGYRATALAWPDGLRSPSASFVAHRALRGKDREEMMRVYLHKMKREGKKALSQRMVARYRAEDAPSKPGIPWEAQVARAIDSLAKRLILGAVKTDRDDWWNAREATARRRATVVAALRKTASNIASAG